MDYSQNETVMTKPREKGNSGRKKSESELSVFEKEARFCSKMEKN